MINIRTLARGLFKIEAVNVHTGARRELAPWQSNIITDNGLNGLGDNRTTIEYCHVGSGTTAETASDLALGNWIAKSSTASATAGASASAPYYGWRRFVYRFNAGVATGNLSELGTSNQTTNGNLFSRALIRNALGNPITITVLADEYLDVTYEFRQYVPTGDQVFSITVSGVTYNVLMRAASATDNFWGTHAVSMAAPTTQFSSTSGTRAYSALVSLGDIASPVSGTLIAGEATVTNIGTYGTNNYYRDYTASWDVSGANAVGGIAALHTSSTRGIYKMQFTPNLPKDNTNNILLTFRMSWARY